MATEQLSKPQQQGAQVGTWRRSYEAAREKAFLEMMFLMAEQYSLELSIQVEGQQETVPSPMVQLWRESLQDLSPSQMREGLKKYMASERRSFKPAPEDIRENAEGVQPNDKPRAKVNPDCPECSGTGWKTDKQQPGRRRSVVRCECRVIEYEGKQYTDAPRQLPPAPRADTEKVRDIGAKVSAASPGKGFPRAQEYRPMSDAELQHKKSQAEQLAKTYQGKG